MRRSMAVISAVLVLLGVELSTEGASLILSRFGSGLRAIRAGVDFHVTPVRFGTGVLVLGLGLALWLLILWSGQVRDTVDSVGSSCPACGNKTRRVKRRGWHRVLAFMLGQRLTRRTCEVCGWNGLSLRL